MTPAPSYTGAEREPDPSDAYGAGYFQYQARQAFRDLRRVVGFEEARQIVAEIINEECERKQS